jgi:glycosyltransferase involved in cell wall biosynthesis
MRILHVIPSVAASDGGPAKAVIEMCRDSVRRGADAEIVTTNADGKGVRQAPGSETVNIRGVNVNYYPVIGSNYYKVSPSLAAALKQKIPSADVVHVHSLYQFSSTVAAYYCRRFNVPYLLRPHGTLDPYLFRRHRPRKWLYEMAFERRNLRSAAAVHFVTREEMRLACSLGLEFNPVVAPLGIDLDDSLPERNPDALASIWPETRGRKVILFFGRINFKKGLDVMAQAFGRLARRRHDIILLIAGPDIEGYGTRVRGWLSDEGVLNQTLFTGMLTGARKSAALAGATLFVLPSYSENFGIAVVEAMAAGQPVVISKHVNICREVADAEAGLVVNTDPDEVARAMETLLDRPELAERMGRNGKHLVRDCFSWDSAGPRLMDLYTRVTSPTRTANTDAVPDAPAIGIRE